MSSEYVELEFVVCPGRKEVGCKLASSVIRVEARLAESALS